MDTPMGRLDSEHRKNIATVPVIRPSGDSRVTDTDTEFGVREILGPAVGSEFEIVTTSHADSTIVRKV